MLSPTLVELNRAAFVAEEEQVSTVDLSGHIAASSVEEPTVDLDGHHAASDLDELALDDGPDAEAA